MGSVSSANPGLAYLMQALSNDNSPVLSSPSLVSALQNASPADVVQLSISATELEGVDALFGTANSSSNSSNNDLSSVMLSLENALAGTSASSSAAAQPTSSVISPADQLANYQSAFQSTELDSLLGTGSAGGLSPSLFNVIG
jgi:hypothetical protein